MDRYDDIKRNGSGYYDETPYKAMLGMHKPGEIWLHSVYDREVLILAEHSGFCTVLPLTGRGDRAEQIQVVSRCIRYTNPGMLGYEFNRNLGEFVKRLSDGEFRAVQAAVSRALSIPVTNPEDSADKCNTCAAARACGLMADALAEMARYKQEGGDGQ